jgi:hypothetical protein
VNERKTPTYQEENNIISPKSQFAAAAATAASISVFVHST